ncbi:hypothetical protein KKA02_04495 [Patescibacteria group bacterium]|nr:hypothetical protein [Patescibacteria group bacterium]
MVGYDRLLRPDCLAVVSAQVDPEQMWRVQVEAGEEIRKRREGLLKVGMKERNVGKPWGQLMRAFGKSS